MSVCLSFKTNPKARCGGTHLNSPCLEAKAEGLRIQGEPCLKSMSPKTNKQFLIGDEAAGIVSDDIWYFCNVSNIWKAHEFKTNNNNNKPAHVFPLNSNVSSCALQTNTGISQCKKITVRLMYKP